MRNMMWGLSILIAAVAGSNYLAADENFSLLDVNKRGLALTNNRFALDLYDNLTGKEGNTFFSPYSISTALAMTYAGSRGETAREMAQVLHFGLEPGQLHPTFAALMKQMESAGEQKGCRLAMANRLWGQKGYDFLDEFLNITKTHYGAELGQLDFETRTEEARKTINDWIEKRTEGKIKDLIQPGVVDTMTRLVLTNAIYFLGDWRDKFDKNATRDAPFHVSADREVTVPMMFKEASFRLVETLEFQALELPYVKNELSMLIFLPRTVDGLPGLEKDFALETVQKTMEMRRTQVRVYLPRFKLTAEFKLNDVLIAMGMKDAFGGGADFSGMTGRKNLFISAVVHKAYVDVNEQGTEAAAATAVIMKETAMALEPKVFRADHPFLFLIRHNATGSILFMGRLANPK